MFKTTEGDIEKPFFPKDENLLQTFEVDVKGVLSLQLVFQSSTDFFGRITIYKLEIIGSFA